METAPIQTDPTAAFLGRLAIAATVLEVPVTGLVEQCRVFGNALGRFARVTTDDRFETLSVASRRPADRDLDSRLVARDDGRKSFLEFATDRAGDISIIEHRIGRAKRGVDLGLIRAGGVSTQVLDEYERRLAILAPMGVTLGLSTRYGADDHRHWVLHTEQPHATAEGAGKSTQRILAAAEVIGVSAIQRRFIAKVHGPLARGQTVVASVATDIAAPKSELRLSYQKLSFETIVRLLGGIYPDGNHDAKLGGFAGAFNQDNAASLVLILRDQDPLAMTFSIEVGR